MKPIFGDSYQHMWLDLSDNRRNVKEKKNNNMLNKLVSFW